MTPESIQLQDLVTVFVLAGILAGILVLHFLVALADIRKQIRELRRAVRGFPGIRPSRSGFHPRGERSPDNTTPQERIEES